MSIGTADAKRVDTDTTITISRPGHWFRGYYELLVFKRYCHDLLESRVSFDGYMYMSLACSKITLSLSFLKPYESGAIRHADLLLGLGVENLMFGGIVLFSKANTALIKLVKPEAPSEWPTFGLTYISETREVNESVDRNWSRVSAHVRVVQKSLTFLRRHHLSLMSCNCRHRPVSVRVLTYRSNVHSMFSKNITDCICLQGVTCRGSCTVALQ